MLTINAGGVVVLRATEIKARLRVAVQEGCVRYTGHAQEQMKKRGFTVIDVERVLKNGIHDFKKDCIGPNGFWRYRIHGSTIDAKKIKVAVEIEDEVVVITVID